MAATLVCGEQLHAACDGVHSCSCLYTEVCCHSCMLLALVLSAATTAKTQERAVLAGSRGGDGSG